MPDGSGIFWSDGASLSSDVAQCRTSAANRTAAMMRMAELVELGTQLTVEVAEHQAKPAWLVIKACKDTQICAGTCQCRAGTDERSGGDFSQLVIHRTIGERMQLYQGC